MNAISTLKARMGQTKDLQQLREGINGRDADLMGNGYCVCIYDLSLIPSAMEAEKELLEAALKVSRKYEENAKRMVIDEILDGMVAVWGNEIPGLADAIEKDRGYVVASIRQAVICLVEATKKDEADYEE